MFKRITKYFIMIATVISTQQSFAETSFNVANRNIRVTEHGELKVKDPKGLNYTITMAHFIQGWRQLNLKDSISREVVSQKDNELTIKGKIPFAENKKLLSEYTVKIAWSDTDIKLNYQFITSDDYVLTPRSYPFVLIDLPMKKLRGEYMQIGSRSVELPAHNKFGWGDKVLLPAAELQATLPGKRLLSAWSYNNAANVSVRCRIETIAENRHESEFNICFKPSVVEKPKDLLTPKPHNYSHILKAPLEEGVNNDIPLKWAQSAIDMPEKEKIQTVEKVEEWLEFRSRLYAVRDKNNHLAIFKKDYPATKEDMTDKIASATQVLNAGDLGQLEKILPELEKEMDLIEAQVKAREGISFMPASDPNPFGWVKAFSTVGFKKHPEGVLTLEPSPLNTTWYDDLSISIDELMDYESKKFDDKPSYRIDFENEVSKKLSFKRSWVTTEWKGDKATYTHSVLTPMIDVSDTDTVTIRLNKKLKKIVYMTKNVLPVYQDVYSTTKFDFNEKPCIRNWMMLYGDGYAFALVMGSKPENVSVRNDVLTLKMNKKSFVSLVRMSEMIPSDHYPREAEFWGRVALALPVQAVEKVQNGKVHYDYQYKSRTDEWGTKPLKIAPVPPLAIHGNIPVKNVRQSDLHTKYGMFSYVPGTKLKFSLPEEFLNEKVLRGVNASTAYMRDRLQDFGDNDCDWIRSFLGHSWKEEAMAYEALEKQIKICRDLGVKIMIDPHDMAMKTKWSTGMLEEEKAPYLAMWDKLSKIGAKNRDVVVAYDIYNEHQLKYGAYAVWAEFAKEIIDVIRKNDPETKIYITGIDMANSSGHFNSVPLEEENLAYSFHFYTPHSFTHQKIHTRDHKESTLFYPGWITPMDWGGQNHFGKGNLAWYDRWNLGASILPVLEFYVKNKKPVHCGEFSVVGYTSYKATNSAFIWTQDAATWLERYKISWQIWNMGFGLCNPLVKDYIYKQWKKDK